MKQILVPIDFSECSINALNYAVGLSKLTHKRLLILHAVQVPAIAGGEMEPGKEVEREVEEEFTSIKKSVPQLTEVEFEFQISFDFLLTSLRKLSDQVDLIVMGTTGASGVKEALIGSNTLDVIKEIGIPVIAIPEQNDSLTVGTMAFASDYKEIVNMNDIKPMVDLARIRNSEIHILHIGEGNNITREELNAGKSQEQIFKQVRHSYHFINGTNVAAEINQYLENNGIKLLVLYARKHSLTEKIFHKSVTREMALHSKIPVFVLPEND